LHARHYPCGDPGAFCVKIDSQIDTIVSTRNAIVGACLFAVACGAAALSLGDSRGAVTLGAAVDLAFEVRPDPGKDLASSCISARLVAGSHPLPSARIQVTPVEGGPAPLVRVQTTVAVDEPVLTATLVAGCEGRVSRTYTFLADLPSMAVATGQPIDIARLGGAAAARADTAAATPAPPAARPARAASGAPAQARPRRAAARKPSAAAPASATRQARPAAPAAAPPPAPRLVMEPWDLRPEAPQAAASAPALPAAAASAAQAAVVPAEEVQSLESRLRKLEAAADAQRARLETEKATVAELRQRLAQVESQGFPATVVYALAGLLVLAVLCIAWLLRRARRQAEQDWQHSVASFAADPRDDWDSDAALAEMDAPPLEALPSGAAQLWEPPQDGGEPTLPMPPPSPAAVPASASLPRAQQTVHPEALFDVLQQAEFFISVGEHEQAIDTLQQHVAEHGEASPVAYLELLRLHHMLGRAEGFERLRERFHAHFNARVPPFSQFHQHGRALEDYPEALAHIERVWASPEVMAVLDGFLFRREGADPVEPFDLAAYDDLLLLLSIVQTVPAHLRGASSPRQRTTPWEAPTLPPGAAPRSLDSLAGDLSLQESGYAPLAQRPISEAMLDVDLTDPPPITISDLPPVPTTAAPAPGQPVGFGMEDDKMEIRFELERKDLRG